MFGLVLRLVVSLGVVLGLFWMVARTGSRKLGGRDRALMRVRSRQSLTRGASLAVVEVGRRVLVVGVGDGGVRLLTEMDPAELAVVAEPAAPRARRLQAAPAPVAVAAPDRPSVRSDVAAALEALDARIAAHGGPAHDDERVDQPSEEPSYASFQEHYEQVYDVPAALPRSEGALSGSLLSPSTWRAAWDTAMGRAHRPLDGDAA